jgi:hypothetical protein
MSAIAYRKPMEGEGFTPPDQLAHAGSVVGDMFRRNDDEGGGGLSSWLRDAEKRVRNGEHPASEGELPPGILGRRPDHCGDPYVDLLFGGIFDKLLQPEDPAENPYAGCY